MGSHWQTESWSKARSSILRQSADRRADAIAARRTAAEGRVSLCGRNRGGRRHARPLGSQKAPAGWHRVVVEAEGYASRVAGHARFDEQPGWHSYDCGLSRPASVSGRIADDSGKPLADVNVRLDDVVSGTDERYESPQEYTAKTDAQGRFHFDQVPVGKSTIWLHKSGYCRPGLGHPITMPAKDVALHMIRSAGVRLTVDFTRTNRPEVYTVQMEPEGGAAIGKWSGSGNVQANNQISFNDVPPGRYVVWGQPNPSSRNEQTERLTIDLKGGQTTEVTLSAK